MMSLRSFLFFTVIALFSISLPATQAQDTYSLERGDIITVVNGEKPTHPLLLDYLANRFVANGWSVKSMIREIVLSRTYGLASNTSESSGQSKVFGQEETPARLNEEIEKLVQQLGDQDFNVRQRASERLFEIGEPALPALQQALESPDGEVVVRARKLLSQIPRKAINNWIEQLREPTFNTDVFLAAESQRFIETGEVVGAQPPLLGYYREAFGDRKNAREYYVALLRKKPAVFVMGQNYLDASPPASQREQLQKAFVELMEMEVEKIAGDQLKALKAEPFEWRGKFHDDIAAVMVVHAATEPELGFQSYDSLAFRITIQSKRGDARTPKGRLRNLITKNDLQKQMLRPVLTHCWSKVTTDRSLYHGMKLFAYFGWNQSALELARRTVELSKRPAMADGEPTRKELQAQFLAAHHLLIFGGKEDIPVAAELLKQDGAVFVAARPPGIPRGPNLEVREMALMALAKLEEQKPEDFGMKENAARCPVAHTVKAFYLPKPDDWPAILARFLPGDDTDEGGAEEAKSDPQN